MNPELEKKIIDIISGNILTPIIYMIEQEEILDFICFCDRNITIQEIYDVEKKIRTETGKKVEIVDIREFGAAERLEVLSNARLIYTEHPIIEKIFVQSMSDDLKNAMEKGRMYLTDTESQAAYICSKQRGELWKRIL